MKKRIASAMLALCLVLALLPVHVQAYTVASGKCGTNLTWELDNNGVLTIKGTGEMINFSSESDAPWYNKRDSITSVVISSGVTSIGNKAFYGYKNLTTATFPLTLTKIGYNAFSNSPRTIFINYPGSMKQWRKVNVPMAFLYTIKVNKFDLELSANPMNWGTVSGGGVYALNSYVTIRATANEGYRFTGWTDGSSLINNSSSYTFILDRDRTLTANFETIFYIVRFYDRDTTGSSTSMRTGTDGRLPSLPTVTRQCHTFEGWYITGEEDPISTDTVFTRDIGVTARWTEHHTPETLERREPTCTKTGLTEGSKCSVCNTILKAQEEIPLAGHTEEIVYGKAATCKETGLTNGIRCSVCHTITKAQEEIPLTPHSPQTLVRVEPTCTATGLTEGSKCSVCNMTLKVQEKIPLADHTEETIVGKAATCAETGLTDGIKCSVCNEIIKPQIPIPVTEHNWTIQNEQVTVNPTCTTKGEKTYTKMCTGCGQTKTETEELSEVEHTWVEETIIDFRPTCVLSGTKHIERTCSVCNECQKLPSEPMPATGEHVEEEIPGKPATCTEAGYKDYSICRFCYAFIKEREDIEPLTHDWGAESETVTKPATCTETGIIAYTKTCQRLGCDAEDTRYVTISAAPHTEVEIAAVDATCTAPGWTAGVECSVCKNVLKEPERVEMAPHRWGPEQEEETKPATCTEEGIKTYKKICAVCKKEESRTEPFGPNGHTVVYLSEVPATCTKDGKTAGEECSVCHKVLKEQKPIPAAHTNLVPVSGRPADCTHWGQTEGVRCDNCGVFTKPQEDIPPLEHAWTISGGTETITKNPTCTEAGEKTITGGSTCSRCNAETTDEQTVEIPPLTHQWGEAAEEVIKPPTCKEKGIKTITRLCTRDGCQEKDEKTEELDLLAHTWGEWKTVQEPTATEAGMKERDCAVCGDKDTEEIAATGTTPGGEDNKPEEKPGGEDNKPEEKPGGEDNKPEEKPGGEDSKPEEKPGGEDSKPEEKPGDEDNKPVTPPGPVRYRIYTPGSISGGSYDVSHSSAVQGARITVEVSPRRNYELEWLAVTNLTTGQELHLTQRGSDEYTFVMPASSVELDISYDSGRYIVYEEPQLKTGPNAWYYRDRHIYHVENGLVPDGTHITRDMLISVLYNMTSPAVISNSIGCETNDSQVWATDNGIVPDIYASGLWGFDKILSREQAAMLIFRYAGYRGCGTAQRQTITRYSDYSRLRPDARAAMSWAVATGLMPGTSASTLAPQDSITCGQMGELLFKFEATILR